MRVLMVTPHLPPHQAANALLPHLLGESLTARGNAVRYLTFGDERATDQVTFIKRRGNDLRALRLPQMLEAFDTWRLATPLIEWADVVHIHSNTWMNQVAARLAVRHGKPYLLTHYGTEIWHYDDRSRAARQLNARARHVTFYSQALLDKARELGVPLPAASVVYPPIATSFHPRTQAERAEIRQRYLPRDGRLLLNVKRLHPLADHATLLEALAWLARTRSDVQTLIAGSGETAEALRAQAERLGLNGVVRFLGLIPNDEVALLQNAADLFVLSSVLEATPTVVLEALASDTPVVSTDNPGGVELAALFGDDVCVVPKQNPAALAAAIAARLDQPRRVSAATRALIAERFSLPGVSERYEALYREACYP
ncbi:MAG: glycosyltransferase [Vicinamibacteria bacterium]|jgi:glycosyltransferase involved in cell wall biosynthesis|nr:glycosyltransferase [Vicinamibacteria bacterium]